jgi:GAF domain-containing protein
MAVPVPVGDGVIAVLLVTDSLPDIPTSTGEHLRLLQAMANHVSVSLANARLVGRLRQEVAEKEHLALHDRSPACRTAGNCTASSTRPSVGSSRMGRPPRTRTSRRS